MDKKLTLKEKFLLLNYHPEKGRLLANSSFFSYGLSGTCLLELAGLEKININNKKVTLLNSKKTGDNALDLILDLLGKSERPKKISTWISKLSNYGIHKKIKRIILDDLLKKRILRREDARALFIFKYNKYPARDTVTRKGLIQSIQDLVLRNKEADHDTILLVALLGATRGVNRFFTGKERKIARQRVKEIMKNTEVAKVVNETITAIQGAIIASIAATAVVTSSGH